MKLSKDDPLYYKIKINELIQQAEKQGLLVKGKILNSEGIQILFESDNGDTAGVNLLIG